MFFTPFGHWAYRGGGGGGLSPKGSVHNLLMQFFTLDSSKIEVFETYSFDIGITQDDHPRYVKHVSGRIYLFCTPFGHWAHRGGGGSPKGMVHNLLMQLFTLGSSKSKFSKLLFLIL